MIISIRTKQGNIYNTLAIEIINDGKDMRFHSIVEHEQVYVIVATSEVEEVRLV